MSVNSIWASFEDRYRMDFDTRVIKASSKGCKGCHTKDSIVHSLRLLMDSDFTVFAW
jgi:hypothetical protein